MKLTRCYLFAPLLLTILFLGLGCSDRDTTDLGPARGNTDPLVFDDDYGEIVYFQPYFQTHATAVSKDSVYAYGGFAFDGARSLKVNVPTAGSALGIYTGGVLTSAAPRDLADYNALTFYARANENITLDKVGFGDDNTGTSLFGATRAGRWAIDLTEEWTFHVVPIPGPWKLLSERGLFMFAEGLDEDFPEGYDIWFDEIRFADLGNVEAQYSAWFAASKPYFVGSTVPLPDAEATFRVDGQDMRVSHSPWYYDIVSSNPGVAEVSRYEVKIVGEGEAVITGTLGEVQVFGQVTVSGHLPPTAAAAPPTLPAENVISMFSDVYQDIPVDTWTAEWSKSEPAVDLVVAGDNTKMYGSFEYAGILFPMIDASGMTHFHMDVWAPTGTVFRVKFRSLPPGFEGETIQSEVPLFAPEFTAGSWSSLEISLDDFNLPANWDWSYIGELIISSDSPLVLVDNVYWHD